MSLTAEQLKEAFTIFSRKHGPAAVLPATVTAVNNDDTIALVFSDGSTVDDARLKAVVKAGDKYMIVPAAGTNVLACKIENSDEYYVLACDEISEMFFIGKLTRDWMDPR